MNIQYQVFVNNSMSLIDAEKVVIREMDLQFWSDERIVAVFRHWDWFKEAKRPQKFESVA